VPRKNKILTTAEGRIDLGGWECQGQTDLIEALDEDQHEDENA
jgi:hypothetical protein